MATRLHPNMDLDSVKQKSGFYMNQDIPLQTAVQNPLTDTAQTLNFQVPPILHNWSKSSITLNYTVPSLVFVNNFEDCLGMEPFSSLTFGPQQGTYFVQLTNPALSAKTLSKLDVPLKTFMANDDSAGFHLTNSGAAYANSLPVGYVVPAGNSYNTAAGTYYAAQSYPQAACVRNAPVIGNVCVSRVIPLGQLTSTLFALEHDQFFNTIMNLTLTTAPIKNFGFTTATINTPGAAGVTAPPTPLALTSALNAITLNSMTLNLAVQMDQDIINSFMSRARAGKLSYQVPYLTTMSAPAAIGNNSVNVNLSSAYGKKLKRLVNVVQTQAAALSPFDVSNFNGSKVSYIGTTLGGVQLQKKSNNNCLIPLYASQGNVLDDYREMRKFMSDSCLQDYQAYSYNWFWCDSFSERSQIPSLSSEQIDEGYQLSLGSTTYMINLNAIAALTVWTFVETIRHIEIGASGPVWLD